MVVDQCHLQQFSPHRRHRNLGDDMETIGLLASLIDQAERCLPEPVTNARANGTSWRRIAQMLGTSPD